MSEANEDITIETDNDDDLVKRLRQEIRDRDSRLKEVETAKSQLERKQTFQELGINPNEGTGALFFKAYDGELEADSIREEAEKYGIPIQSESQEQKMQEDASQHEKMNAASAGATPVAESPDPSKVAGERFDEVFSKTGNREEAMAQFFGTKLAQTLENRQRG